MRIFNFLLAVMFLSFAFLQVNDPDPVLWILVYGVMAVFAVMAIFEFFPRRFLLGYAVLLLGFSMVYIPGVLEWWSQDDRGVLFDDLAKMEHLYIEEAREFLGLMICEAVLIFYILRSRKRTV